MYTLKFKSISIAKRSLEENGFQIIHDHYVLPQKIPPEYPLGQTESPLSLARVYRNGEVTLQNIMPELRKYHSKIQSLSPSTKSKKRKN